MAKNYFLAIASYKDEWKQDFFENIVSKRNKEYCKIHDMEYIEITKNVSPVRGNYMWFNSFEQERILNEELNYGDGLIFVDADAIISNIKVDLLPNKEKHFSYAIDSGNTHCLGYVSMIKSDWTQEMLSLVNDEKRYNSQINEKTFHERKKEKTSFWEEFGYQASWYSLAGIRRHSDTSFWDLPNYGWHSQVNEWTYYTIEDLEKHVEILPTKFNVTEIKGESPCLNNINKVKVDEVVIRHFAGGQKWRKQWTNTNSLYFKILKVNIFKYINFYKIRTFIQRVKGYIKSKLS
jgi:hypothetical protein